MIGTAICIGAMLCIPRTVCRADTSPTGSHVGTASITGADWGATPDGQPVKLFTLTNRNGMRVTITNYGATLTSIWVPDRSGAPGDVILGFNDVTAYVNDYFGQTIGRYANRIAHGQFTLDGVQYQLKTRQPAPALHGGGTGFHMRVWELKSATVTRSGPRLVLFYDSPDGDQNFPGELKTTATFTLGTANTLRIDFNATTSKPTIVNLTEHTYFNLAGDSSGDVLSQLLRINAQDYTPTDRMLVPTGEIAPVAGTPLDFTTPKPIGRDLAADFPMLKFGHGYDVNFVLNRRKANDLELAAQADDLTSGRELQVWTTQPGVQFYTGNGLNSSETGIGGTHYAKHDGFALECQHFPDSPNHPNFPSTELDPGQRYHQVIEFRFSVTKALDAP